ncbi:L,D-transpeptidase [Streptomyces sp. NPDC048231]|uniref:L,D-transpeptidase n=1 Tax=Streptomyces sp. NPDC048231 TaxID=3365519 RepID=UPI003713D14D
MSDDLTAGLRALAESGQAPPPVPGSEIRRRAGVRRHRRRTAAAIAGASAAAALGVVALLGFTGADTPPSRTSPASMPTNPQVGPSAQAGPAATVDLSRRTLTIGRRELPVSAGTVRARTPTGRMTVTALANLKTVPGKDVGLKGAYRAKVRWVVELRAADGTTTYLGGLVYNAKAPGHYDVTSGWIGLDLVNAKWLHGHLRVGDVVEIEVGGSSPDPVRGATGFRGAPATPTPTGTVSFFGGTGTP